MSKIDLAFVEKLGLPVEFPGSYFPDIIEQYRQELILESTIPGEFIAAGMLAACSGALGNSVVGRLGAKRFIPLSLFQMLIGNPGTGKSPALDITLEPIRREHSARILAANQPAEGLLRPQPVGANDVDVDTGSAMETNDDAGEEFHPGASVQCDDGQPMVRPIYLTDTTAAGLRTALLSNPRGVIVSADEAVSLFKGAGKSASRQDLLHIWNVASLVVARGKGKPAIAMIPRAFATVVAGVQPDMFPQLRNPQGDDGLLDRFMLFGTKEGEWPVYSHCAVSGKLSAVYNDAVDQLIQHRDEVAEGKACASLVLDISHECSLVFEACHNHLKSVLVGVGASQKFGGVITKTVANAQRLAVLRACIRSAADGKRGCPSPTEVTVEDAEAACMVARFSFGRAILWRPELVGSQGAASPPEGRSVASPGSPMVAAGSTDLGQRIVAYMERRNLRGVEIRTLQSCGSFSGLKSPELRNACQRLVDIQLGEWMNHRKTAFCLLANTVADLRPAATATAAEQGSDDVSSTQESAA